MNKLIACSKLGAKWDNRITLYLDGMDGRREADCEEVNLDRHSPLKQHLEIKLYCFNALLKENKRNQQ